MTIFQIKKNSDIFHISDQNIDCGYWLEPPRRGGSNEYPQSMFLSRNNKNNVYPCNPSFTIYKWGLRGSNYIGMFSWWHWKINCVHIAAFVCVSIDLSEYLFHLDKAYLIEDKEFMYTCCGIVSHLNFNADSAGILTFQTWRQKDATDYELISSQTITAGWWNNRHSCDSIDICWLVVPYSHYIFEQTHHWENTLIQIYRKFHLQKLR